MKLKYLICFSVLIISGCATTGTDGIVEISPNLYMYGGHGNFTDYSGAGIKARLYKDAGKFCGDKGLVLQPVSDSGQDASPFIYASAEIKFRCVKGQQ